MRNKNWIRLLAGLACVALLIGMVPVREAHAESTLASGFVYTTKLNLRKGAGTKNAIVDTLAVNTAVNIYEVTGTWLRIDVPSTGKSGYVSGKYITVNGTSLSAYALGCTSGRVNLRKEATSKSTSLAVVAANAGLTVYFADAGEEIWDIARRYNTTVEAVEQENGITGETVAQKCMLLIPGV